MPLLAFIVTIAAGIFTDGYIGVPMNWPNAGTVIAVAVMGCFILWAVRRQKPGEESGPPESEERNGE